MKLDPKKLVTLNRPFAIFVEPGDVIDDQLVWFAKIVGFGLDNIVYSDSPTKALTEAVDLLRLLSGKCPAFAEHVWVEDKTDWYRCTYCDELTNRSEFLADEA